MSDILTRGGILQPSSRDEAYAWAREHWYVIVLGAITLVGAAVRVYDLTGNPRGFFADEASFGLNAHLILTTGKDEYGEFLPILFRAFGEYKLPAFVYAEVPFVALFGQTELAVRLTAAFIGTATIITTYLMSWEIFRRRVPALAAAALLAILPWHIHYSRTGLGDIICFPLLLTLALYLFFRAMRDQRPPLAAAVAFGLTFYTYRAAWVLQPPLLLILALLYHRELLQHRRAALQCAAIIAVLLLPIMRHLLSDTTDRSSQAWIFDVHNGHTALHNFWEFYKSHYTSSYLFTEADNSKITRHYLPGHGVLYPFMAPLILVGIVAMSAQLNRRYVVLLALLLLFPLGAALSFESPHSSRAIFGSVVFASLAGAGLATGVELTQRLQRPAGMALATGLLTIVAVLAGFSFSSYLKAYYNDYPRLSDGFWGWQDGPQQIIAKFEAVQGNYDELFLDRTFNSPRIFIPFYAGNNCPRCYIGDSDDYDPKRRQLFALRPEDLDTDHYDYVQKDEVRLAGDELGFVLVEISRRR